MSEAVRENKWLSNPLVVQVIVVVVALFLARGTGWFDTQSSNSAKLDQVIRDTATYQAQVATAEGEIKELQKQLAQDHVDNERKFLSREVFEQFVQKQDENHTDAVKWREQNSDAMKQVQDTLNSLVGNQRRAH